MSDVSQAEGWASALAEHFPSECILNVRMTRKLGIYVNKRKNFVLWLKASNNVHLRFVHALMGSNCAYHCVERTLKPNAFDQARWKLNKAHSMELHVTSTMAALLVTRLAAK